ncbi:MAG: 3-hydroxyacyl-CoA dehydrogenase [Woeseiaceae bacterium]|nr:enoyl-CoA hydratase/isomerase family protein [Gammaproteobacteria bacterium]NNK25872.1 3-hydroxyacyl-CoA dehydrogenase [Woeseiaceae bacterium]
MPSPVNYTLTGDIGVITIDHPPVNALSLAVRQGIMDSLDAAAGDASRAVLIICEGRTFCAGADISEFGKPPEEPWLPAVVNRIEAFDKPVVAALHGTALGGGFEIALGAHYRCALASAKIGLPEVRLGLLPGAGGTQRTPRLAGVGAALDLMTSGVPVDAHRALAAGLIDRVFDADLADAAMAWIAELVDEDAGPRRASELPIAAHDGGIFDQYRARLAKKARGQVAPQAIVDCVEQAAMTEFADGEAFERETFMKLMAGDQSAALRHFFFAEREAAKVEGLAMGAQTRPIESVGIIGGGTMGGGIAMSFANAGFAVTLVEISDEALDRGLSIVDRNYTGSVKRGKLSEDAAAANRARIAGSTDYANLADVDLVIEAVFEDPGLKKEIFARLDGTCKPGAILATNTSYQDVDAIAAVTGRPQDVIGLHFFSPAHIMKLLEVVRGEKTADDVLATCMQLAKRLRKVPVVSGVCYGFIGNRMLRPYGKQVQLLLLEGASPGQIDAAMEGFGMAMGPLRVFDLAGLDVGYKARQALPDEMKGDPATYRVPELLVEAGRLGQKSGAGFYRYDDDGKPIPDPAVDEIIERTAQEFGIERREIGDDEIVECLLRALVDEGRKIVAEGIAQRESDIDVVYVYGYGFPAWRGGPMHYGAAAGL